MVRGAARSGRRRVAAALAALALAACVPGGGAQLGPGAAPSAPDLPLVPRPAGAPEGSCWVEARIPARYETVTEQRLVRPERRDASGKVIAPAEYASRRVTRLARPEERRLVRVLCPPRLGQGMIAALQRALAARGAYRGPVSGALDRPTRAALARWQEKTLGVPLDLPAHETARRFGLVPWSEGEGVAPVRPVGSGTAG